MKKIFCTVLAFIFTFSLVGCSNAQQDGSTPESNPPAPAVSEENTDNAAELEEQSESQPSGGNDISFDLENGVVRLNSGYDMPVIWGLCSGTGRSAGWTRIRSGWSSPGRSGLWWRGSMRLWFHRRFSAGRMIIWSVLMWAGGRRA